MQLGLILGVLDKSLSLISDLNGDRPKLAQREINSLFKLQEMLRLEMNKEISDWDFEVIANISEKIESEIDRIREVKNA